MCCFKLVLLVMVSLISLAVWLNCDFTGNLKWSYWSCFIYLQIQEISISELLLQ